MDYKEQAITASSINVIAGIWLIIAPYVLGFGGTVSASNSVFIGIIIGVMALISIFSPMATRWVSWVNVILGIWLIISPFILGYTGLAVPWNAIILGLIVGVMAIWGSTAESRPI